MSNITEASLRLPQQIQVSPYRHERALFAIVATLAIVFWILITLSTIGIVWIYMLFIYVFVLFAHSALIAFIKGNTVRITEAQFPDLYERIRKCCWRLGIDKQPECYLMTGDGMLNAFATRFLRRYYVVLLSDVVDALESDPEAVNFYIGHELGHIDRKHIANGWWLGPVLILPLLGAAYRRAQEYTCDQYGLACCDNAEAAARALAVLAAGTRRWKSLNTGAYVEQTRHTGGFWMSVNELASDYPWLCKRMAHIHAPDVKLPARHPLAWLLALFMPRFGPGGPLMSLMMLFAVVGVLAATAMPAYRDYKLRAELAPAFRYGSSLTQATGDYYESKGVLPPSVESLGLNAPGPLVKETSLDQDNGTLTLNLASRHEVTYTPSVNEQGKVVWSCATDLPAKSVPPSVACASTARGAGPGGFEALFK